MRSQALPNVMTTLPTKDVIEVRELREDVQLYHKDFESNVFQFVPSFQDFLTDHIDFTMQDMTEKVKIYEEQFYRTAIFHGSPSIWICGKASGTELTNVPYWASPTIALSKTQATMQALVAQATGTLDLNNVRKLGTVMYTDIAADPFSGNLSGMAKDGAMAQKYCLIIGTEVWDNFTSDAFLLSNRALDLNIITDVFQGSLFGRFTTMHERFELRVAADGTFPVPEIIEENPNAYNYGEVVMNPVFVNATHAIGFACGGEAYKYVSVGAPPKYFAQGEPSMKQFRAMNWNGQVEITKDIMVPCLGNDGITQVLDTNKRGEYLQLISDVALGILPIKRRNIVPILYKRARLGNA